MSPTPQPTDTVLPSSTRVLVIGGGIVGLSIAYHLAQYGVRDVCVLERDYLCAGASGRNGGGVRAQWSSARNIHIMRESLQRIAQFSKDFGIQVWFRRGGYLFLARSEARAEALAKSVELQRNAGLRTELKTPREAQRIVPQLDASAFVQASFGADDGVVFPWPFVWGYAHAARALGVRVLTHTELLSLEREGGQVQRALVRSKRSGREHTVRFETAVIACGAWSKHIAALAGVELPTTPHRHEICSSEPLKPWLGPLVADLDSGLYFSQSTRGEIVGGIGNEHVPPGFDQRSSYTFLARYGDALTRVCPPMAQVKVLRQWAGLYDLTADANPIVGFDEHAKGLYFASGFMGHGFMMAPTVGERIARELAKGERASELDGWDLARFREGRLLRESLIIG